MANHPQKGNNGGLRQEPPLTPDLIGKFLENQAQSARNEAAQLKLQEKELELNAKQAELILQAQSKYLMNKDSENRKTFTRIAWIAGGFFVLTLGFIVFCLTQGFQTFIMDLLKYSGYVFTTLAGYYFGKKSEQKKPDSDIQEAVIED